MKKLFFLVVFLSLLSCDKMQNSINIPDLEFKKYLLREFDNDGDSEISKAEALLITEIYVDFSGITSIEGVEYFPNLEGAYCYHSFLETIDLSKNHKLKWLNTRDSYDLETIWLSKKVEGICDPNSDEWTTVIFK